MPIIRCLVGRARDFLVHYYSPVAQLVEQMTVNHWVPGSSPGRGAKYQKKDQELVLFFACHLIQSVQWSISETKCFGISRRK